MDSVDDRRAEYSKALRAMAGMLDDLLLEMFGKRTGFTMFMFDLADGDGAPGAISYISNANRADMIDAVREWIALQEAGITSGLPGERARG